MFSKKQGIRHQATKAQENRINGSTLFLRAFVPLRRFYVPGRRRHVVGRACLALLTSVFLIVPLARADERILDYHSDIEVFADGSMQVTETIRVRAEKQEIKRGIYRDFPTDYRDRLGNRYRVGFEVVDVGQGLTLALRCVLGVLGILRALGVLRTLGVLGVLGASLDDGRMVGR